MTDDLAIYKMHQQLQFNILKLAVYFIVLNNNVYNLQTIYKPTLWHVIHVEIVLCKLQNLLVGFSLYQAAVHSK